MFDYLVICEYHAGEFYKVINHFFRTEKDNVSIKHEIEEIKIVSDEVTRAKVKDFPNFGIFLDLFSRRFFACKCFSAG